MDSSRCDHGLGFGDDFGPGFCASWRYSQHFRAPSPWQAPKKDQPTEAKDDDMEVSAIRVQGFGGGWVGVRVVKLITSIPQSPKSLKLSPNLP